MKKRYETQERIDGVWTRLDMDCSIEAVAIAQARLIADEESTYRPDRSATIRVIDTNTGGKCWQG